MIVFNYPQSQVDEYIEGVLDGSIVTGRLVKLAVRRHLVDLENAWERGYKFDPDIATRACAFYPHICKHSIGEFEGQPFHLFLWQQFVTWVSFGWRRLDNGYRRFRRIYISIARKGGKTSYLAATALRLMLADEPFEPGAELYATATKEDQAKIMFNEAVRIRNRMDDSVKGLLRERKAPVGLFYESKDSFFKPIGSDSDGTDGLNPHAVFKDELHAWREKHRGLKEKLETGGGARRQPLDFTITTAGDDHSELWKVDDDHAVRVLESVISGNIIDDELFAFICRIDEEDDPFDESCWPKANPGMPVAPKAEYIRDIANLAKQQPTALAKLVRYCCNRRVGSLERAISIDTWMKGAKPLTVADGAYGHGGLDLGRSNDWAAIAACFPIEEQTPEGRKVIRWELKSQAWTVKDGDFKVDREPFRTWIAQGRLIAHEGDQVDFREVVETIVAWSKQYQLLSWAFDPAFARIVGDILQNEHGLTIFAFTQSPRFYNEPCVRFVEEMQAGRVLHGNDPVLEWQAGNLEFSRNNAGLVMPDKSKRESKIDGLVAGLMAFSECLFAEKNQIGGTLFYTSENV